MTPAVVTGRKLQPFYPVGSAVPFTPGSVVPLTPSSGPVMLFTPKAPLQPFAPRGPVEPFTHRGHVAPTPRGAVVPFTPGGQGDVVPFTPGGPDASVPFTPLGSAPPTADIFANEEVRGQEELLQPAPGTPAWEIKPGWQLQYSQTYKRSYYYNMATGETSWDEPG